MKAKSLLKWTGWAGVLCIAIVTGAVAQVQNGVFTGTVTDPQGAALAGAIVTITNQDTGYSAKATTNESGVYTSQALPVGNYKFSVESAGFKTATKQSVKLDVGTTARLDFKMSVGQATETVEVTTEAALVNTEDSRLTSNVTSQQIANLPLNGRNVYDLIQMAPGAVNVVGVVDENGANTVVNGLRENFNGFLLNGVSNKGLSGGAVQQPIQDSVQEFQLLTLNMSAQYGNSAGSITNLVTKSGSNALHGSVFGFFRNRKMDANNFFNNQQGAPRDPLDFKQFGATIGGPIIKDKLFFFGAYQGDRFKTATPPAVVLAESPEFRQAVAAAFGPDSVARVLYNDFGPTNVGAPAFTLDQYLAPDNPTDLASATPVGGSGFGFINQVDVGGTATNVGLAPYFCDVNSSPAIVSRFTTLFGFTAQDAAELATYNAVTGTGCAIPAAAPGTFNWRAGTPFMVETLNTSATQTQGNLFNGDEYSVRVDWNATNDDRVFGQWNWTRQTDQYGPAINGARNFFSPFETRTPNLQLSWTHVFTPNVVNELKGGYAGLHGPDYSVDTPGVPFIGFDDGSLGFGAYNGYPQTFHENIYTYSDLVSVTKGKHNIKVGGEVRRNIENSDFNVARPSYYFFDPLFFAADAPYVVSAGVNPQFAAGAGHANLESNIRHWRNVEFGAYFQDDWKVHPRLTLNLGLRYDLYQRHTELNNLATTFDLGPGNNIIEQMRNANILAGNPGCDTPEQIAQATLAGVCGPGGFAAAESLGAGDHNNFGPRVGFAWDVFGTGKTSVRAGYGLAYEGTLYNPLSNSRWNPPYYSFNTVYNFLLGDPTNVLYGPQDPACGPVSYTGPACPANNQGPASQAQATGNIGAWDASAPNLAVLTGIIPPEGIRDPYVHNAFLSVQQELFAMMVLEVDYVGTFGHKLFRAQNINRSAGGRLPEGVCITTQDFLHRQVCSNDVPGSPQEGNTLGRINGNYGNMREWQNVVNSNYNGLQVSLKKATSHGIAFNLAYTWSHSIDDGSTWHSGATTSNGAAGGEGYTTDLEFPQLDRGNSIFDVRHRLVFNWVWDLPLLKDYNAFVRSILGGWSYNGLFTYQSGAHWSPFIGLPRNLEATDAAGVGCDAATLAVTQANCINLGGDYNLDRVNNDRPNSTVSNFDPSHQQWAEGWGNADALFSTPCLGCVGNLGRNTFVGPSFIGADMSLFKNISITERWKAQFRWEVFNVFNKTNFQLPGANLAGHNLINDPLFGQAGSTFNPRQMQLGLKISF